MKNTLNEKQEQFNRECKLINLKYEYQGYKGTPQWAIVSEYSEKEIMEKYADVVCKFVPFVSLTIEQNEAFKEYNRIEDKFKKRDTRHRLPYDISDGQFEVHHPECISEPDYIEELELQENIQKLNIAISTLSDLQKSRLIKYFFEGKSFQDIASEEGVSKSTVSNSVYDTLKKLKKFF